MSSQVVSPPNTEAAILARIIASDQSQITPEIARYLLSIQFPSADRDRVNELSARARAGMLAENEMNELDSYLHVGSLLAVMKSKARQLLRAADLDSPLQ